MNNGSYIKSEQKYENYLEFGKGFAQEVVTVLGNCAPAETGNIQLTESVLSIVNNRLINKDVPLYAFSVGDLAFVTAPAEIFSDNAVAVRDASKFPMTLYASCANGYNGYIPTPKPFDYYSYEVRITKFPMGTAEVIQEEQIKILAAIFAESGNIEKEKAPGYLTTEFEPVSDGITYISPGGEAREVENGYFAFILMDGATPKIMLAISKEVADAVLAQTSVKVLFNEQNVVVGIAE